MSEIAEDGATALEELLQFLYLMPVGVVKFAVDGTVALANPMASQLLLPLSPEGDFTNLYDALAPLVPGLAERVARFAGDAGPILDMQRFESDAGGKPLVVSLTINRINETVYMAVLKDVTTVAEQERKIFADQQRFRAIFDNVRDYAIYTINLEGQLDDWNHSIQRFGGWEAADVVGQSLGMCFPKDDPSTPDVGALLAEAARVGSIETEGQQLKRDGSRLWGNTVITALPDEVGAVRGFVVVARDMTERKRLEDELTQFAMVDPLTNTFNRRYGHSRLLEEFERRDRFGHPFAVLLIDIDKFKSINDTYGHDVGDVALRAMVQTCKAGMRTVDMLARWGGEEFLVLLPDTEIGAAIATAERLRVAVAATPVTTGTGAEIAFTVSIGVATPVSTDANVLLQRADAALYSAKTGGRNRVVAADF